MAILVNLHINKHITKRLFEIISKRNHCNNDLKISLNDSMNTNVSVVSIPYYGNLSEIVKRLLQKYDVKVVFRINSKLDKFIILGKDPYEIGEQNNVVYQISCNCGKCELMNILRISILMKSFTISSVNTVRCMKMIKRITFFFGMMSKFYIKKPIDLKVPSLKWSI